MVSVVLGLGTSSFRLDVRALFFVVIMSIVSFPSNLLNALRVPLVSLPFLFILFPVGLLDIARALGYHSLALENQAFHLFSVNESMHPFQELLVCFGWFLVQVISDGYVMPHTAHYPHQCFFV